MVRVRTVSAAAGGHAILVRQRPRGASLCSESSFGEIIACGEDTRLAGVVVAEMRHGFPFKEGLPTQPPATSFYRTSAESHLTSGLASLKKHTPRGWGTMARLVLLVQDSRRQHLLQRSWHSASALPPAACHQSRDSPRAGQGKEDTPRPPVSQGLWDCSLFCPKTKW